MNELTIMSQIMYKYTIIFYRLKFWYDWILWFKEIFFRSRADQFQRNNIDRELNKAFVGFFNEDEGDEPSCIATGNWGNFKIMIRIFFCLHFGNACFFVFFNLGCGAFGGDPQLKSLIQLMAAAENGNFTKKSTLFLGMAYLIKNYLICISPTLGRDLLYFTFGDEDLRDKIFDTYTLLIDNSITVGMLYQVS